MAGELAQDRTVLRLSGADHAGFLKGLVTRDPGPGLTYSALLTPQGKYLADFFLLARDGEILVDVQTGLAPGLAQRLAMYRLRADVVIEEAGLTVTRGLSAAPEGAYDDPRHPSLGWRAYGQDGGAPEIDWDALRVAACVPETGIELIPNETFILEAGFDRLGGVDHRKGCYVGQEVTARMKHKTELKKGLARVSLSGVVPVGTEILAGEKSVGRVYTQAQGQAIAYLRFDRAEGPMQAGDATVIWDETTLD